MNQLDEELLKGLPILDEDWKSEPSYGGYYWYRKLGGEMIIVHVNSTCQYVTRFTGESLPIKDMRGKFYGPLKPTRYGI